MNPRGTENTGILCALCVSGVLLFTACVAHPPAVPSPAIPTTGPFPVLLALGDARAATGQRTAAEDAYRQAAAARPSDPAPALRLALLYVEWNRPAEGLAALDEARQRGAAAAQVEPLLSALYAAQGDWTAVVEHGTAALVLDPTDAAAHHLLAQAYVNLGRADEAQAAYQALVAADPTDSLAHERLGGLLALSDPAAARPHLQAAATPLAADLLAVLDNAGDVPAYRLARIGQACLEHGEPGLAALALRRAVVLNPAYADGHALLGQALDALGDPAAAQEHLETAARLAPDAVLARSLLGLHYLRQGNPTAARPHLESAYTLDPQNPAFSLYLATLYAALGQYAAADIWWDEATRLAAQDPLIWEAMARFYLERGITSGQRGWLAAHTLASLAPQSGVAHDLLGWAHALAGRYDEAQDELLRALELDPSLVSAYDHLGQLYTLQGRYEEARVAFTRALDANTDPALRSEIEDRLSLIAYR